MDKIDTITSDDALLLAYVAGELSGEALQQVEARFAAGASLGQRAARLHSDYQQIMQAIGSLDQQYRVDERKSLRRINALFQEWEEEQVRVTAPVSIHRWRPPVWSYAAAAMVALLIGFCFWWANNSPVSALPDSLAEAPTSEPASQMVADASANPTDDSTPVPVPLAFQDVSSENLVRLERLEKEVVAISDDQSSANNNLGDINQ